MTTQTTESPFNPKIAIVTGANRGLGLEVARQLKRLGMQVVLTARDVAKGQPVAQKLGVRFFPLDVRNPASVNALREYVVRELGHVDVLINNAAVYVDGDAGIMDVALETTRRTVETNVYGPMLLCQALIPLMSQHGYGRVVNVSSRSGQLSSMGTSTPSYNLSKTALNALTVMFAKAAGSGDKDILVNACCPGWVRTDMGGSGAPLTVEQGADTIVWLATLPKGGPTGGFFAERKEIEW